MIAISSVIGNIFQDKELADKFEKLKKTMSCEVLKFSRSELDKTRFRKQTDKGTDIGCILDSEHRLQNGDVMYSNTEKIIIIEQIPEKVISVKIKKIKANSEEILVKLGHIIGFCGAPVGSAGFASIIARTSARFRSAHSSAASSIAEIHRRPAGVGHLRHLSIS